MYDPSDPCAYALFPYATAIESLPSAIAYGASPTETATDLSPYAAELT